MRLDEPLRKIIWNLSVQKLNALRDPSGLSLFQAPFVHRTVSQHHVFFSSGRKQQKQHVGSKLVQLCGPV
ncbi:MAG TPA: hypothetical protein VHN77_05375, partial [Phycisphaerales bacterium]|nr:hypothetical protein [Phycisphaerales bacterium]